MGRKQIDPEWQLQADISAALAFPKTDLVGWAQELIARVRATPAPGGPTFTLAEITAACENVGVNLACGACASVFFTGVMEGRHDDLCPKRGA